MWIRSQNFHHEVKENGKHEKKWKEQNTHKRTFD